MTNEYDDNIDDSAPSDEQGAGVNEYDMADAEVSERRVGSEPIMGFGFYGFLFRGSTPSYAFDDKTRPILRHRAEVVLGPEGTVGKTFFFDQPMAIQRQKWTDQKDANGRPIFDPLTGEELAEAARKFRNTLKRVATVLGFTQEAPKDKSLTALGVYAAQFEKAGEKGTIVIGEVKKNTRNGFTKNIVWLDSIAGVDDAPSADYRGKAKTALDEAKEKIEAKNKALAAQDAKNGRPAQRGNARSTVASSSNLD